MRLSSLFPLIDFTRLTVMHIRLVLGDSRYKNPCEGVGSHWALFGASVGTETRVWDWKMDAEDVVLSLVLAKGSSLELRNGAWNRQINDVKYLGDSIHLGCSWGFLWLWLLFRSIRDTHARYFWVSKHTFEGRLGWSCNSSFRGYS